MLLCGEVAAKKKTSGVPGLCVIVKCPLGMLVVFTLPDKIAQAFKVGDMLSIDVTRLGIPGKG